MLYIKNRRIYTDSFSFELPEDLCLISDPPTVAPDTLHFETLDGLFEIEIGAWDGDNSPYDQLLDECLYSETVLLSTIFEVERDGMKGFGAYYHSAEWTFEYYEERLQFEMNAEGQTTFILSVTHNIESDNDKNQVKEFMSKPNIKSFIDSIRYNPEECQSIIEQN